MRQTLDARILAVAMFALLGSGCTHYHYYGQAAPFYGQPANICDPPQTLSGTPVVVSEAPVATRPQRVVILAPQQVVPQQRVAVAPQGSICEVPAGETLVVGPNSATDPVVASTGTQKSSTLTNSTYDPNRRYSWHRPNPDSLATTRISGEVQSSQVR